MIGTGTIVNAAAIVAGGFIGMLSRGLIRDRMRETVTKSMGFAVIVMGLGSTMSRMLTVTLTQGSAVSDTAAGAAAAADGAAAGAAADGAAAAGAAAAPAGLSAALGTQGTMMMIISLALGALIGEVIDFDGLFERFGTWLRNRTGNENDTGFIDAFLTASFTVCIGAMAIIGSIQDGLYGDPSTLFAKSILDLIIVAMMTASLGKGCIFSAIPVALLQGSVTLLAGFLAPLMTEAALSNISLVGNILITCVGVNLVWSKTIRVANLLPALVIAVIFALV